MEGSETCLHCGQSKEPFIIYDDGTCMCPLCDAIASDVFLVEMIRMPDDVDPKQTWEPLVGLRFLATSVDRDDIISVDDSAQGEDGFAVCKEHALDVFSHSSLNAVTWFDENIPKKANFLFLNALYVKVICQFVIVEADDTYRIVRQFTQ